MIGNQPPGVLVTRAESPPLVTDGGEVSSLLVGLLLASPTVLLFIFLSKIVRKRFHV